MKNPIVACVILVFLCSSIVVLAQELFPQIKASTDSLAGFDEAAILKEYNLEIKRSVTYPVYLNNRKELYKTQKYNLNNAFTQKIVPNPASTLNTAFCNNSDFANGTFSGWTGCSGCNPNGGSTAVCPSGSVCSTLGILTGLHTIMASGTMDQCTGAFPAVCPGYAYSARLGTSILPPHLQPDGIAEELDYQFIVPAAGNAVFTYNYTFVLENSAHTAAQSPYFEVVLYTTSGDTVPCSHYKYIACSGTGCLPGSGFITIPSDCRGFSAMYKPWTAVSIDLSPYASQALTARFIAADCTPGGHFGYAYIDCSCSPLVITQSVTLCGSLPIKLYAPVGYATYNWLPGGQTTDSIAITAAGSYSVTVVTTTGCQKQLTYIVTQDPVPIADFNIASALCSLYNVSFTDASTIAAPGTITNWHWEFGDGTIFNGQNPPPHNYASNPANPVTLVISTSDGCSDSISKPVSTGTIGTAPIAQQNGNVLASSDTTGNQWNLNGSPISGATSQFYTPSQSGFYSVTETDSLGCSATSNVLNFIFTGIENPGLSLIPITIFPNPSTGILTIDLGVVITEPLKLSAYNTLGQEVYFKIISPGSKILNLDISGSVSSGIYNFRFQRNSVNSFQRVAFSK